MVHQVERKRIEQTGTDFSLLLNRLERAVLHNDGATAHVETLNRQSLWQHLEPEQKLKWAGIAQIAGQVDTALAVYKDLVKTTPELQQGWIELLELLSILDQRRALAAVLARARHFLGQDLFKAWEKRILSLRTEKSDKGLAGASVPFERMRHKRELMEHFMALFSGREDVFARQWADKNENKSGYVPVRHAMTLADVDEHVQGRKTYGIYLLQADSRVRCGVIDVDIIARLRSGKLATEDKITLKRERTYMITRIREQSAELGLTPVVEFSGYKGFHFWYFFSRAVDAAAVRSVLTDIAQPVNADISCFDLEVFPKQGKLTGKGLGNLVKLPLGIHRFTGKQSFFMECPKRDIDSQLGFLKTIQPVDPDMLTTVSARKEKERVVLHPRMAGFARQYPEIYELERLCPPLGQIISTLRDRSDISTREEKVLYQTVGFLPRRKTLLHYLMAFNGEYNPHLVDFRLSKLSGTPLGCRRIHSLLGFTGDFCEFKEQTESYLHPLLHLAQWQEAAEKKTPESTRINSLQAALENMKTAIIQVQRFIQ